jgi:hypothetical protein
MCNLYSLTRAIAEILGETECYPYFLWGWGKHSGLSWDRGLNARATSPTSSAAG